ncbi:MAG TPA: cellulase family glycosylhydrolase [Candidatus Sumerlaeota bacterium]|nr:cellulase family glycosylhydrolase [Candidatus Sumerlaeota bacterium]
MTGRIHSLLLLALLAWNGYCADLPQKGDVVFQTGFDSPSEQQAWPMAGFAQWDAVSPQGGASLLINVPPDQAGGSHMLDHPLDLAPCRDCRLLFECMAKADNVTTPPASFLGIKFMLYYNSIQEGPVWLNENNVHGTFNWRKLRFMAVIPSDAAGGRISLGLQDSSGTVRFDSLKITVMSVLKRPVPPIDPPPVFKGHNLPRLRGIMSPNVFRDEDMRVLGMEWNANVIRWQITRNWGLADTDRDLAEYDRWLNGRLVELDRALVACRRYGIKVVVDMHTPPGGRYENSDLAIFHEKMYQDHFVALWEKIARRYKGNPAVWGYDLVNEPVQSVPSPEGVADYLGVQTLAARAVRDIDPDVPIFIATDAWNSAASFRYMEPIPVSNIIYQVHVYNPHQYTHQGVREKWTPLTYPGEIAGRYWDKTELRRTLQPVRDFQTAWNAHIYVGEFSAVRWAPGAAQYLRDCIELFEEYGWDWTYHAYREWDGWSVEHGSDPGDHTPTRKPADRRKVLLEWFRKNRKTPGPSFRQTMERIP